MTHRGYLESWINLMTEPLRSVIQKTHDSLTDLIYAMPAAVSRHHHWVGGYADHVSQVMYLSYKLWAEVSAKTPSVTQDDVLLVAFVHDLDKLWRYRPTTNPKFIEKGQKFEYRDDAIPHSDVSKTVAECFRRGILLEDKHLEAIDHHHGGWSADIASVYSSRGGGMTQLSTILHCADMLSTKVYGTEEPVVMGKS